MDQLSGILGVEKGGTGTQSIDALKTALGLDTIKGIKYSIVTGSRGNNNYSFTCSYSSMTPIFAIIIQTENSASLGVAINTSVSPNGITMYYNGAVLLDATFKNTSTTVTAISGSSINYGASERIMVVVGR